MQNQRWKFQLVKGYWKREMVEVDKTSLPLKSHWITSPILPTSWQVLAYRSPTGKPLLSVEIQVSNFLNNKNPLGKTFSDLWNTSWATAVRWALFYIGDSVGKQLMLPERFYAMGHFSLSSSLNIFTACWMLRKTPLKISSNQWLGRKKIKKKKRDISFKLLI